MWRYFVRREYKLVIKFYHNYKLLNHKLKASGIVLAMYILLASDNLAAYSRAVHTVV